MIDDEVRHHISLLAQCKHIIPVAEPWIKLGVIHRVKSSVCAINRMEERWQVHPTEKAMQGTMH